MRLRRVMLPLTLSVAHSAYSVAMSYLFAQAAPVAWTFTQGFLVGQACFVFMCLVFIRYVVFSTTPPQDVDGWRRLRAERAKKQLLSSTAVPPPSTARLLGKTAYEVGVHPNESTDWMNVMFAQVLQGYRNDLLATAGEEGARQQFERWLNPPGSRQSWLDPIEVTALNLGTSYPSLSGARICAADREGNLRTEIDIDYTDTLSLSISTNVVVNFPRPRFAVLPVAIGVELVSFAGTVSVQNHNPKDDRQHLHVCLLPVFHLNLKTTSLLGSRAKLQDIPKLEQLIEARLRAVIQDRYVYPNKLKLALPRIISHSNPDTSLLPTEDDVHAMAADVMARSLGKLGQGFADRMAAVAPAENSSGMGSDDTPPESSQSSHVDLTSPVKQHKSPKPTQIPMPPPAFASLRSGNVNAASSNYSQPGRAASTAASSAVNTRPGSVAAPGSLGGGVDNRRFRNQLSSAGFSVPLPKRYSDSLNERS